MSESKKKKTGVQHPECAEKVSYRGSTQKKSSLLKRMLVNRKLPQCEEAMNDEPEREGDTEEQSIKIID